MTEEFEAQWAIVELMGRKVVAGRVEKSILLGPPMLRVDVPATSAFGAFTQFYGDTSIYCVTFVSEEVARRTAEETKVNPVSVYVPTLVDVDKFNELKSQAAELQREVYRLKRLPEPVDHDGPDEEENDDDE